MIRVLAVIILLIPSSVLAVDTFVMTPVKAIVTCAEDQRMVIREAMSEEDPLILLQIAQLEDGTWQLAFGNEPDALFPEAGVYYPDRPSGKAEFMIVAASHVVNIMPDLAVAATSEFGAVFLIMTGTANLDEEGAPMDAKIKMSIMLSDATVETWCVARQTLRSSDVVDAPVAENPFPPFPDAEPPFLDTEDMVIGQGGTSVPAAPPLNLRDGSVFAPAFLMPLPEP